MDEHTQQSRKVVEFPYRGRVRTGCLTCRRVAKVKCDESRPRCQRCTRLKRTCIYQAKGAQTNEGRPALDDTPETHRLHGGDRLTITSPTSTPLGAQHLAPSPSGRELVAKERQLCSTPAAPADFSSTTWSPASLPNQIPSPGDGVSTSRMGSLSTPFQCDQNDSQAFIESSSALALMTSQDIYLCTTIDLLAANEIQANPSFAYFVQEVRPPILFSFDEVNWGKFKLHVSQLGNQNQSVGAAILALQDLYKALANGLSTSRTMGLYRAAVLSYHHTIEAENQEFEVTLANTFLLALFEMLMMDDTGSILDQADSLLENQLGVWSLNPSLSPLCLRISAWLLIIHSSARRGGNPGILSHRIRSIMLSFSANIPSLSISNSPIDVPTAVYDLVSAPIFTFYLEVQKISAQVADLSHYHRSRSTVTDQEEVWQLMAQLKAEICCLWEARPPLMRFKQIEVRDQFSPAVVGPLMTLIGLCRAAYHTEIVEIGRTLSDPPLASAEAKEAMCDIKIIIEEDWNAYVNGKLNAGYLRPLFLYAIEAIQHEETQWAVTRLREIQNAICRSDFFASFAEALTKAQRCKGRRVTTKYFCYQTFGVSPPFL